MLMLNDVVHHTSSVDVIKKTLPIIADIGKNGLNINNVQTFFKMHNLDNKERETLVSTPVLNNIMTLLNTKHSTLLNNVKLEMKKNIASYQENMNFYLEAKFKYTRKYSSFADLPVEDKKSEEKSSSTPPFQLKMTPPENTTNLTYFLTGLLLLSFVVILIFYINKKAKFGSLYTFKDFIKELFLIFKRSIKSLANTIINSYVKVIASLIVLLSMALALVYILPPPTQTSHPILKLVYNALWSFINKSKIVTYTDANTNVNA